MGLWAVVSVAQALSAVLIMYETYVLDFQVAQKHELIKFDLLTTEILFGIFGFSEYQRT